MNYEAVEIPTMPDDKLYLFSDGVTDQLGDEIPKKYSEKRLRQLLEDVSQVKLSKQKEIISDFLDAWQGKEERTDDQLLIGLTIN